ncbi:MAG TPA: hypothetical protein ENG83_13035 [Nitrospirae bacterium]|nr:hypothetical protein BMS3Abin06_00714 [bacterium BMS3Abin06]HDH13102.1 hypothetical protein [Nitrospirota bacterium]HDZ02116.1 hypothetical protein [Nitrospirota bacterium]
MKKYLFMAIMFVLLLFCGLTAEAMVRTEGVLDLNKMASEINGNMHDVTLSELPCGRDRRAS